MHLYPRPVKHEEILDILRTAMTFILVFSHLRLISASFIYLSYFYYNILNKIENNHTNKLAQKP